MDLSDLAHLVGPITENTLLRRIKESFQNGKYLTRVGPVLLSLNPFTEIDSHALQRQSSRETPELATLITGVLSDFKETNQSQVILLSGESGSGKTWCSHQLLHHLFHQAGGGSETDTFKHLSASITVLQSLVSAQTVNNIHSSRAGFFYKTSLSNGAIHRTVIHGYFIEQPRTTHAPKGERNFDIFYQLLAGLTGEEKLKYHLSGYEIEDFHYLFTGPLQKNGNSDKKIFMNWKSSLVKLGISFSDLVRILAAILLLGNIDFVQNENHELEINNHKEFHAVAALLGIPAVVLYRGLTCRTRTIKGQICKSAANSATASWSKHLLAQCLYSRIVKWLLKITNSRSNSPVSSNQYLPDVSVMSITEDFNDRADSDFTSYMGQDRFIGIMDLFGSQNSQLNQLSHLCMNLCSENLERIYSKVIFRGPMEACLEEGIRPNMDIIYKDNIDVIDLIARPGSGILDLLDTECQLAHNNPGLLIARIRSLHSRHRRLLEQEKKSPMFGIEHFSGHHVIYDAYSLLQNNRDSLPDDIVCMFTTNNCNFTFATQLFYKEINSWHRSGLGPRGIIHRLTPDVNSNIIRPGFIGTVSSEFVSSLNKLLAVLNNSNPCFIRCIKSNDTQEAAMFDSPVVTRQLQSLQVLETVKLMAGGLPHKLSYNQFNQRYQLFLKNQTVSSDNSVHHCKLILQKFLEEVDGSRLPYVSVQWALGKTQLLYSEGCRQQLNAIKSERLSHHACRIQAVWRGHWCRKNLKLKHELPVKSNSSTKKNVKKRPVPAPRKEFPKYIKDTCKQLDLTMDIPPPIPVHRNYTIYKNMKIYYPQIRILTQNYHDAKSGHTLHKGQEVEVVDGTEKGGNLVVTHLNTEIIIPHSLLKIKILLFRTAFHLWVAASNPTQSPQKMENMHSSFHSNDLCGMVASYHRKVVGFLWA